MLAYAAMRLANDAVPGPIYHARRGLAHTARSTVRTARSEAVSSAIARAMKPATTLALAAPALGAPAPPIARMQRRAGFIVNDSGDGTQRSRRINTDIPAIAVPFLRARSREPHLELGVLHRLRTRDYLCPTEVAHCLAPRLREYRQQPHREANPTVASCQAATVRAALGLS